MLLSFLARGQVSGTEEGRLVLPEEWGREGVSRCESAQLLTAERRDMGDGLTIVTTRESDGC